MRTRRFTRLTGEIPVVGLGTWNMERDDRKGAIAALRRGIELGVVHIDTAEMYGNGKAEEIVAEAIAGQRDRIFLVSKVLPKNAGGRGVPARVRGEPAPARDGSPRSVPSALARRCAAGGDDRRARGAARGGQDRAWGVSNFDDADLDEVEQIAPGRVACNQVFYHLLERAIEHRVIPWCEERGVAVVAYSPFGSAGGFPDERRFGELPARLGATPRQLALAYLTRRPSVLAIPKASRTAHVEEIARDVGELDAAALAELDTHFPLAPWRGLPML